MAMREQIATDVKDAMRAGNREKVGTLRLLSAAIKNLEVARTDVKSPQHGQPITDADVVGVVQKEIKQRQDSIALFEKGGRQDLADKERAEIAILQDYLPAQLSRADVEARVNQIIGEVGRDFRKVMPEAAKQLKGQADGRLINEVVRELTA